MSTTKKPATTSTSKKPTAKKPKGKAPVKATAKKPSNTASVKKAPAKLTLAQKYEYLDRVSAYALYTNSTIVGRTENETTFRTPLTIIRGNKKEQRDFVITLVAAPYIDFTNVPVEEKGMVLFKNFCDALRLGQKYNTVTFVTAYGDKYSYNAKGVTQMYNAKTKKWEVVPTCKTECQK